jgi:hypothetical protein
MGTASGIKKDSNSVMKLEVDMNSETDPRFDS